MNVKVEEFIKKAKAELLSEEKKQRDEHLVSLGLVDESKTVRGRKYSKEWVPPFQQYDKEKDLYYYETEINAPLEVSDEEYKEILKYAPLKSQQQDTKKGNVRTPWAVVIEIIAYIYLIVGVVTNIVWICTSLAEDALDYGYMYNAKNAELERLLEGDACVDGIVNIVLILLSFPLVVGFSKLVAVAERYLHKR